jgi:ribosome-binding factor A
LFEVSAVRFASALIRRATVSAGAIAPFAGTVVYLNRISSGGFSVPRCNHKLIMKNHQNLTKMGIESLCAEMRPDDGIPTHVLKKQHDRDQRAAKRSPARALQYYKAVRQCLDSAFGSVCADPLLMDLAVCSVEPLGRGAKLLVVVETPPTNSVNLEIIEASLQQASGLLRSVVAGEVHRKRTPHLSFRVVPGNVDHPETE